MQARKIIKNTAIDVWRSVTVYSAFYKHHKAVNNGSNFEKTRLTENEEKEYRSYWKVLSPIISIKTVEISKSLSGKFDKRIIPEEIYALHVEPYLNDNKAITFFENKSIYSKWFNKSVFPTNFFHKFNGIYYNNNFIIIDDIEEFIDNEINEADFPIVIKPNKGTIGGAGVNFIKDKNEVKKIIKEYSDLVAEEKIQQSNFMVEVNEAGISTVRVTLYRDKNGESHILETNLRMGKDGSLDNEGDGGIACNIDLNSVLNTYATDRYANKYLEHPNSSFTFAGKKLPLYKELVETSKDIFTEVIGARIAGLDMILDSNQNWRCIELSFFGLTTKPSQYGGDPFLGRYTDEIVNDIVSSAK
ncbi:sugar-transfer associated ATP-grasp domain-containing protein [uncultured Psychrobacter sp.]|uniref:sugar-transfer associated ATP-grasp domain-containing protein n=1 Tax=uncultured Psychrobacter sp. TaxID=259303 RepID=UPI00345831D4